MITLQKYPEEDRNLFVDFSADQVIEVDLRSLAAIDQFQLVRESGAGSISNASPVVEGNQARVRVSGGASGDLYAMRCVGRADDGQTMLVEGKLLIV